MGTKRTKGKKTAGKSVALVDKKSAGLLKKAQDKPMGGLTWKGNVAGDAVGGEILSFKEEQGKYGPQMVVIVDTPEGPRRVFCNESLKRALDEEGAKPGKRVVIVFKGTVSTRRGRPFKVYSASVA